MCFVCTKAKQEGRFQSEKRRRSHAWIHLAAPSNSCGPESEQASERGATATMTEQSADCQTRVRAGTKARLKMKRSSTHTIVLFTNAFDSLLRAALQFTLFTGLSPTPLDRICSPRRELYKNDLFDRVAQCFWDHDPPVDRATHGTVVKQRKFGVNEFVAWNTVIGSDLTDLDLGDFNAQKSVKSILWVTADFPLFVRTKTYWRQRRYCDRNFVILTFGHN